MPDVHTALHELARVYFEAAYEMDADRFQSVFHPQSTITRLSDEGEVMVTPLETWLGAVRRTPSPRDLNLERADEILSISASGDLAFIHLRLQAPPKYFTDVLSCLKVNGAWRVVQKVMCVDIRQ